MSCYHPKLAYKRYNAELGKFVVSFSSGAHVDGAQEIKIPCGKCIGCLRDRAAQWAIRCACEYETTPNKLDCYFLTLTYSDDNLPFAPVVVVDSDGVVDNPVMLPSLRKSDLQLFFKRCRFSLVPDRLRYLACGEYGGQTGRPHYHGIFFGLHLADLVPYKSKDSSSLYFTSKSLDSVWKLGNVLVARYDYHTADYVAKYLVKQNPNDIVDGREKPFLLMSRRPGLGRDYYDQHLDGLSLSDKVYTPFGVRRPPFYFDRIDREARPDDLFRRKDLRYSASVAADQQELKQTDRDFMQKNRNAEQAQLARRRSRKF